MVSKRAIPSCLSFMGFYMKLVQAIESYMEPGVQIDDFTLTEDTSIEEQHRNIEDAEQAVAIAQETLNSMYRISDIVKKSTEKNISNHATMELARITIANEMAATGLPSRIVQRGLETFDRDCSKIALENAVVDFVKKIWAAIKKTFARIWEFITGLFKSNRAGNLDKKTEIVEQQIEATSNELNVITGGTSPVASSSSSREFTSDIVPMDRVIAEARDFLATNHKEVECEEIHLLKVGTALECNAKSIEEGLRKLETFFVAAGHYVRNVATVGTNAINGITSDLRTLASKGDVDEREVDKIVKGHMDSINVENDKGRQNLHKLFDSTNGRLKGVAVHTYDQIHFSVPSPNNFFIAGVNVHNSTVGGQLAHGKSSFSEIEIMEEKTLREEARELKSLIQQFRKTEEKCFSDFKSFDKEGKKFIETIEKFAIESVNTQKELAHISDEEHEGELDAMRASAVNAAKHINSWPLACTKMTTSYYKTIDLRIKLIQHKLKLRSAIIRSLKGLHKA
jgi:hypothetical protein